MPPLAVIRFPSGSMAHACAENAFTSNTGACHKLEGNGFRSRLYILSGVVTGFVVVARSAHADGPGLQLFPSLSTQSHENGPKSAVCGESGFDLRRYSAVTFQLHRRNVPPYTPFH